MGVQGDEEVFNLFKKLISKPYNLRFFLQVENCRIANKFEIVCGVGSVSFVNDPSLCCAVASASGSSMAALCAIIIVWKLGKDTAPVL